MSYRGSESFSHRQADKIGVLISNLGTPDAPEKHALKRYLAQFLSDPRVVEIPRVLWMLILHGIILRIRPKRSAEAYASVWTDRGSPLLWHTEDQCEALKQTLQAEWGDQIEVAYAMRYGQPAIDVVTQKLLAAGVRKLLILPLYPQYSGSTTASTFDALSADFQQRRWLPHLRFIASYHDHPAYIEALAEQVRAYWDQHGRADKLVLSFHGVPMRYLQQGDPYHCQCHATSRLLAEALDLGEDEYMTTFQSRFGKAEWLKPYTDATLKSLPGQGVKHVQIMCPGFAADCLETLEEIEVENREYFMEAGGESYQYIPALNAGSGHISALKAIVSENLQGWQVADAAAISEREKHYRQLESRAKA